MTQKFSNRGDCVLGILLDEQAMSKELAPTILVCQQTNGILVRLWRMEWAGFRSLGSDPIPMDRATKATSSKRPTVKSTDSLVSPMIKLPYECLAIATEYW